MPVLKNKTQGNYVNVYKGIVMDRSLSLKDRGMLLTLLSLPDNCDFTVAGIRNAAKKKELRENGRYIYVIASGDYDSTIEGIIRSYLFC